EGAERVLIPVDLSGQPLSAPLSLGLQAPPARVRHDGAAEPIADCPQATLVRHGDRLFSSHVSIADQRVLLTEVRCGARADAGGLSPVPLPPPPDAGPADRGDGIADLADGDGGPDG